MTLGQRSTIISTCRQHDFDWIGKQQAANQTCRWRQRVDVVVVVIARSMSPAAERHSLRRSPTR